MRLEWLEDILAIAQTGSFSGAAERRNLTQSAFSRRIQQIEDHVGVELFDRSRKPVQLHSTTQAQGAQIELISAALRQLVVDLRRGDRVASNRIVIASQHSLTTSFAPKVVQGILDRGEDIYVRLRSANLDECYSLLLSRQADVAILYAKSDEDDQVAGEFLDAIAIGPDHLIPVISTEHSSAYVTRDHNGEVPYVAYPTDVFFGTIMTERILPLLQLIRVARPKAETALTNAALEIAATGIAVAWVPESLARRDLLSGRLCDLSSELPSCALTVHGVRLRGSQSHVESVIWNFLRTIGDHL